MGPGFAELPALFRDPEPRRVGRAARGVHHDAGPERPAELRVHLIGRLAALRIAGGRRDTADLHLGAQLDAAVLQGLVHGRAALLVEATQHAVAAQHQVDVAAEPVEDAGELDGDITGAHDRY